MLSNSVGGGCAENSSCNYGVFFDINILLFALYIVFIGLCNEYNGNFLCDSRFFETNSISSLVISNLCVNSPFINSKLQSNFYYIA